MRGLTLADPALLGGLGFSPLSLSPALWLDASDTSTITSSGSPAKVSQWNDKSGNGRNVAQATSAAQPTTGTVTQNGRNVLVFDGNDYLSRGATGLGRNVTGMTIYSVAKFDVTPTTENTPLRFTTGTSIFASRATITAGLTSGKLTTGGRTLDTDSFVGAVSASNVSTAVFQIQTGLFDIANTDLYTYINTTLESTNNSFQAATVTSNTDSQALYVGTSNLSLFLTGKVAELLVFHAAHDASTRTRVWDYLLLKWGL